VRSAVENSDLAGIHDVDIEDVITYVHEDLRRMPDYESLYRRYLKQHWNVYDLDFTQDRHDWRHEMTEPEREAFLAVSAGLHHGERQVEVELPVFMMGGSEQEKVYLASQIEDEARHTVFFDRFYREAVGIPGDSIEEVLDASFEYVSETFVGPFGLLAYQAEELRNKPDDQAARVRYGTTYFLWIEGVLALSVMKITLGYCRKRGLLPGYYAGFTATCRDEARHVQGGMRFLADSVRRDPKMLREIHETLRTILWLGAAASRPFRYDALGWNADEVQALMVTQFRRKLSGAGIRIPMDISMMIRAIQPELAGG
jgi:ribonucleoside-diphosphate reductase beta chain